MQAAAMRSSADVLRHTRPHLARTLSSKRLKGASVCSLYPATVPPHASAPVSGTPPRVRALDAGAFGHVALFCLVCGIFFFFL